MVLLPTHDKPYRAEGNRLPEGCHICIIKAFTGPHVTAPRQGDDQARRDRPWWYYAVDFEEITDGRFAGREIRQCIGCDSEGVVSPTQSGEGRWSTLRNALRVPHGLDQFDTDDVIYRPVQLFVGRNQKSGRLQVTGIEGCAETQEVKALEYVSKMYPSR